MLTLFPDEKIILQSDNDTVVLTTHRVLYEYKEWGKSYNQNIMLEHITSSENLMTSKIWLAILAGILGVGVLITIINGAQQEPLILGLVAAICWYLYGTSKRNLIVISSPSTRMLINVKGMSRDTVLNFINKVEQAKHTRTSYINQKAFS